MAASFADDGLDLTRNERYELRLLASHPHIVERVIAESTDEDPPSRRKVLAAIQAERQIERQRHPDTVRRRVAGLVDEFGIDAVLVALSEHVSDD